ncbi:lipoprotein [Burkholderia pseudomallei]|nr:lipoprotein [Burkholderia pseudomallei]VCN38560.1 lipoprotein [Burkholderia pseudomallei]
MRNACDQLYRNWAMLQPRDRAYHTCILDSLGDVKDTYAVQQLAAACSRQSEGAGPTFKCKRVPSTVSTM